MLLKFRSVSFPHRLSKLLFVSPVLLSFLWSLSSLISLLTFQCTTNRGLSTLKRTFSVCDDWTAQQSSPSPLILVLIMPRVHLISRFGSLSHLDKLLFADPYLHHISILSPLSSIPPFIVLTLSQHEWRPPFHDVVTEWMSFLPPCMEIYVCRCSHSSRV